MFIIAHFRVLSTEFSKKIKVFRFGNSCALCARLPRQLRAGAWVCLGVCAGVCYARIKVRATLGGGFWARCNPPFLGCFRPRFGWVFRRFSVGVLLAFLGVVLGWVLVVVKWANVNGNGERVKANGRKGARQTRQTAQARTGARLARFRPSVNLIFLTLIIFAVWWGVFYSQTATEKRRTVCVRSLSLPRPFFRTPNTSVR